MSTNRISVVIPPAVKQAVIDNLTAALEALTPYLYPLSDEDRQKVLKLGDRSLGFIEDVLFHGDATPALVPSFVDMNVLKQDVQATNDLEQIHTLLTKAALDVESTKMQTGGQVYNAGLLVYENTKTAVRARVHGAQVALDAMGKRFGRVPAVKKPK